MDDKLACCVARSKGGWLCVTIVIVLLLGAVGLVSAGAAGSKTPDGPPARRSALLSSQLGSLVVPAGGSVQVTAAVRLRWTGEIQQAYLVLTTRGVAAAHTILVNGQPVGTAPAPAYRGTATDPVLLSEPWQPVRYALPPTLLQQDWNSITLTNDADPTDSWRAERLQIEIHGYLNGPPVSALVQDPTVLSSPGETTADPQLGTVSLLSSYELARGQTISQVVWYQIPADYSAGQAVPLLIALHGMGSNGQAVRDLLAPEANSEGWLLAAPDTHGDYYINTGAYALGWPGAQHDVIDTIEYMASTYSVDAERIYLTGGSMGAQSAAIMAAKYPDIFAAVTAWKGFSDLGRWYYELDALGNPYDNMSRIRDETGGTPVTHLFDYQRRSPLGIPQNARPVPLKMWHDTDDLLVPVAHSVDLRDAINAWSPTYSVQLIQIPSPGNQCPDDPWQHCYDPEPADLLSFMDAYTLSDQAPASLTIRSDESKIYHWMRLAQSGSDHWSEVEATLDVANDSVSVTISDTQPLTVALNIGTTSLPGPGAVLRPGLGLPATTYLVSGAGISALVDYAAGYLTTTVENTAQTSLSISPLVGEIGADPGTVVGSSVSAVTITTEWQDRLGHPVPDGAQVRLDASEGTFPNGHAFINVPTAGGLAVTSLTVDQPSSSVSVQARINSVIVDTSIEVVFPALELHFSVVPETIHPGEQVNYSYLVSNPGDVAISNIVVVDDAGTPGQPGDDLVVCGSFGLQPGASKLCTRTAAPQQTVSNTATVTGQHPLGGQVSDSDGCAVMVISPAIRINVSVDPPIVNGGQVVTFTYLVSNTGDASLSKVGVTDDNGTPADELDDISLGGDISLEPGESVVFSRSAVPQQSSAISALVAGTDSIGLEHTDTDSVVVLVEHWRVIVPLVVVGP